MRLKGNQGKNEMAKIVNAAERPRERKRGEKNQTYPQLK